MANADDTNGDTPPRPGFPFVTVGAAAGALFAFLFLMWLAATGENPLAGPKRDDGAEPKYVPILSEVRGRNESALKGVGAKMSLERAHGELLGKLKGPDDRLPFPTPEPPEPPPPPMDEKKTEMKGDTEKQP